jgi:hypothetical protein
MISDPNTKYLGLISTEWVPVLNLVKVNKNLIICFIQSFFTDNKNIDAGEMRKVPRSQSSKIGMHRTLFLPDIRPAGYPANPKAGYRISGRISGEGRIPNIRPDT